MHVDTQHNDYMLQHPSVGTNSYTVSSVWNNVPYDIRNAPSVMSFRKQLKILVWNSFKTTQWLSHIYSGSQLG